jgi:hypothetical protein
MWSEEHVEGPREGEGMKGGGCKGVRRNSTDFPSNASSYPRRMECLSVCQLDKHVDKMTT